MRAALLATLVVVGGALTACPGFGDQALPGADLIIPDEPVFADVEPVLASYCLECHGAPPANGAPSSFRLDLCEDSDVLGAQTQAPRIVARVLETPAAPMPPFAPFPAAQEMELLRVWLDEGARCE